MANEGAASLVHTEPLSLQDKAEARRRLLSGREPIADLAKEYNRCVSCLLREIATPRKRRNRLSLAECRELSDHFHSAFRLSRLSYARLFGVSFKGVLQALEIARRSRKLSGTTAEKRAPLVAEACPAGVNECAAQAVDGAEWQKPHIGC
jgi:hypothetical protein